MLLLAAWSTNGWLPSGHAMRMALDLGLHRALEKLADEPIRTRTEEEERNLGKQLFLTSNRHQLISGLQLSPRESGCVCIGSTTSESEVVVWPPIGY